ncbi:MAG: hypothetical protein KJZ54_09390 [Phycisphaerales bacterium]|nr:hypothetical protein [Phycisphaerales bacterium]
MRPAPQPVLYPDAYGWIVFAGSLDVMMTWVVLGVGGTEVNAIADIALRHAGLSGLILLKFSVIALVLVICEYVGRTRPPVGRSVAHLAVGLNALPVVAAFAQLAFFFERWTDAILLG